MSIEPPKCPKCKAADFESRTTPWMLWRKCNKCGNEWSGGMGVQIADPTSLPPLEGVPMPEDPITVDITPDYRDPSKNFGGENE